MAAAETLCNDFFSGLAGLPGQEHQHQEEAGDWPDLLYPLQVHCAGDLR